jgi:hypothetical protein
MKNITEIKRVDIPAEYDFEELIEELIESDGFVVRVTMQDYNLKSTMKLCFLIEAPAFGGSYGTTLLKDLFSKGGSKEVVDYLANWCKDNNIPVYQKVINVTFRRL